MSRQGSTSQPQTDGGSSWEPESEFAQRFFYAMELFVTFASLLLYVALGVYVSWWASLGALIAFLLGLSFAALSFVKRHVRAALMVGVLADD
jgi:hypothetical protein